jgi:hypothetical protein
MRFKPKALVGKSGEDSLKSVSMRSSSLVSNDCPLVRISGEFSMGVGCVFIGCNSCQQNN